MAMNYSGKPGEYSYSQTRLGKTAYASYLQLGKLGSRNSTLQSKAGGGDRQAGDHGSHLIPYAAKGRNDLTNLDAQAAQVNTIGQRGAERNAMNLAKNSNYTVAYEVQNFNAGTGDRPSAIMINMGVLNNTTGETDEAHLSFQNATYDQQQSWNDTVDQVAEVDARQDIGMTADQREAANELCGAEDSVDTRLGSGWSYSDFDSSFLDGGETEGNGNTDGMSSEGVSGEGSGESNGGAINSPDGGLGE